MQNAILMQKPSDFRLSMTTGTGRGRKDLASHARYDLRRCYLYCFHHCEWRRRGMDLTWRLGQTLWSQYTTAIAKSDLVPMFSPVYGSIRTILLTDWKLKGWVSTCPTDRTHSPAQCKSIDKRGIRQTRDTLCKNSERISFWPSMEADPVIPTFQSPLQYESNGTDVDLFRLIDRQTSATYLTSQLNFDIHICPKHWVAVQSRIAVSTGIH